MRIFIAAAIVILLLACALAATAIFGSPINRWKSDDPRVVEKIVKETVEVEEEVKKVVQQVVVNVDCDNCPTATPTATLPAPVLNCPPNDGTCWSFDHNAKIMMWTGAQNGDCDIHQAIWLPLESIRGGFVAKFTTVTSGNILITTGVVDGNPITDTIELLLAPGNHVVTSPGPSGGFRWIPEGIGWRK